MHRVVPLPHRSKKLFHIRHSSRNVPENGTAAAFSGTYPKRPNATFSTSLRSTVKMAGSMSLESDKVVPSTYLEIHKESVPEWLTQHDHSGTLVRAGDTRSNRMKKSTNPTI